MTPSIVSQWNSFETWKKRYARGIRELRPGLHMLNHMDWSRLVTCSGDAAEKLKDDLYHSYEETQERIDDKISFLRKYLAYISFDGPQFMEKKGIALLAHQYPNRCNSAFAIWLQVRKVAKSPKRSTSSPLAELCLFSPTPTTPDWASMIEVMPFNRAFVRQPKGRAWKSNEAEKMVISIKEDLEFDGFYGSVVLSSVEGECAQIDISEEKVKRPGRKLKQR